MDDGDVVTAGALAFAGMGLLALVRPDAIPRLMGLSITRSSGVNEVRAVYGGFGLATAASLVCGTSEARAGARRGAGLALLGMAGGRVADVVVRREVTTAGVAAMVGETVLGAALVGPRGGHARGA